jgi:hypothetical protein
MSKNQHSNKEHKKPKQDQANPRPAGTGSPVAAMPSAPMAPL